MKKRGSLRKKIAGFAAVILAVNLIAVFLISARESAEIDGRMKEQSDGTESMFQEVMDNYRHSFCLFVELMGNEIKNNPNPDDIWKFLKEKDSSLLEVEGDTFDGLYMYYKGRYLYSWDTPYSQYEETGYAAEERPWYKDAAAGEGDIVFTPPYMSYANHYILTTLSQLQPDGETVFAYDIKMGDIQELVMSQGQYKGAKTIIFDWSGTIIGSTNEKYLGGSLYESIEMSGQAVEKAKKELNDAVGEEQVSKAEDQVSSAEAFYGFRESFDQEFEKLGSNKGKAKLVTLDGTRYYARLSGQGDYNFLVMIPAVSMMKASVGVWLVPLLLVELLLIYILGRVSKEMKNRELKRAYIELGQTQKRLEVALNAAQKAAAIDDLTGLMNFKSFRTQVDRELDEMDKEDSGILIMIDGDHFKHVNDEYGHSVGDEVIKLSAQMIIGRIRIVDLASRLHGDEFAIFVANTSDYLVAGNIMADINKSIAKEAEKRNLPPITLSSGAVTAKYGDTYTALAKLADEALYRAKKTHNGGFAC